MITPIRKYYREISIVIAGVIGFILYVNYQIDLGMKCMYNVCKNGGSNPVLNTNFV